MEVQIGGPVDTDIPPSTHRQGKDPPERPGWSLWPAPPLTQGELQLALGHTSHSYRQSHCMCPSL